MKEIGGDAFPPSVPSPTWIGTRAVRQSRGAGRTIPQSGGFEKYLTIIHGGRGSSTSRPNIVATKSHARIHFRFCISNSRRGYAIVIDNFQSDPPAAQLPSSSDSREGEIYRCEEISCKISSFEKMLPSIRFPPVASSHAFSIFDDPERNGTTIQKIIIPSESQDSNFFYVLSFFESERIYRCVNDFPFAPNIHMNIEYSRANITRARDKRVTSLLGGKK